MCKEEISIFFAQSREASSPRNEASTQNKERNVIQLNLCQTFNLHIYIFSLPINVSVFSALSTFSKFAQISIERLYTRFVVNYNSSEDIFSR